MCGSYTSISLGTCPLSGKQCGARRFHEDEHGKALANVTEYDCAPAHALGDRCPIVAAVAALTGGADD